jgi:hypothetical protein
LKTKTTTQNPVGLTRLEAPAYLQEKFGLHITGQSLAQRAVYGNGPRFQKVGVRVYYPEAELDAFAMKLLAVRTPLVRSTREAAEALEAAKEAKATIPSASEDAPAA